MPEDVFSEQVDMSRPCTVVIQKKPSLFGCFSDYTVTLNGQNIGFLRGSGSLTAETRAFSNTVALRNIMSGGDSIDFTVDENTHRVTVVYKGNRFLPDKTKKETV